MRMIPCIKGNHSKYLAIGSLYGADTPNDRLQLVRDRGRISRNLVHDCYCSRELVAEAFPLLQQGLNSGNPPYEGLQRSGRVKSG